VCVEELNCVLTWQQLLSLYIDICVIETAVQFVIIYS